MPKRQARKSTFCAPRLNLIVYIPVMILIFTEGLSSMSTMSNIFEEQKKSNIIKNDQVLSYDYLPKILPYREGQIKEIAFSIKPLMSGQKGDNLFIYGAPGIGKTASIKWVLRELKETTDDVIPIYVNCWNTKSKYFIYSEIANQLKILFTQGKSAEHILQQIVTKLSGKGVVFVFDEIDKVDDYDFLYQIVSLFPLSSIILISNVMDFILSIEPRIRSRLMIKNLEFKPYNLDETYGILKERAKLALKQDAIEPSLLKQIANVTFNKGDIRVGLHLLREAAKIAEAASKKFIDKDCVAQAIKQVSQMQFDQEKLNAEEIKILDSVKEKNNSISGQIFDTYVKKGGQLSYRSFKRYVNRLAKLGLLKIEKTSAGYKGKSTIISLNTSS